MPSDELVDLLQQEGRDPSRLIFEDELTGIHNRRFLLSYLNHKIRWKSGDDFPVSLLMMDLDHFKQVNDSHGHDAGDQVLIWLADVLWSEAAGRKALPVRYAGDEFMMLVLGASPADAMLLADRLFERVADTPVELTDGSTLMPQVSIGIATAPGDARDPRELIHRADTALYYAKRSGRNRAAAASDIKVDKILAPTALKKLDEVPVAGRESELTLVAEAVEGLAIGRSRFLIFEGAPGMGKTTLLEAVQRRLAPNDPTLPLRVAGSEQETFRPYYLTARIVSALFAQLEDRGAALLASLPEAERGLLSRVVPLMGADAEPLGSDAGEPGEREAIFNALAGLLGRGLGSRPLLLLVDDLQCADEATLRLLRILLRRTELALVVCATCMESTLRAGEQEAPPLDAFQASYGEELGLRRYRLRALSADDIARHLRGVFPGVRLPKGLEDQLAHVTQGNPLFLVEILRKLVADQRIAPGGQGWEMAPLEDAYLPRSLEEIVTSKIAALDEERRGILEQAAALGEETTLSLLTGTSDMAESKVIEFLDQAQALGLVSLDFNLNDETLRFLGKRVLEISYGTIEASRRQRLHERVASYHEGMFQHILGPSASILAYHFKRSANQEKAARYERMRLDYSRSVYDAREASGYTGEARPAPESATPPTLAHDSLAHIPAVLRTFLTAVRSVRLYPAESDAISSAYQALRESLDRILEDNEMLALSQENQVLNANDRRVDLAEARLLAASFLQLLSRVDLQSISFHRGFGDDEMRSLIRAINAVRPEVLDRGYWRRFSREHALRGIGLKQLGFARVVKSEAAAGAAPGAAAVPEAALTADDLKELPGVLRALLGAMRAIRLYPVGSRPVTDGVAQLEEAMRGVLARRGGLTFAAVQGNLLVDGVRSMPADLAPLAARLRQQLESVRLDSIGFARGVQTAEIETAIAALRQLPPELDRSYWTTFGRAHGLEKVFFNSASYAAELLSAGAADAVAPAGEEDEGDGGGAAEAAVAAPATVARESASAHAAAGPREEGWSARPLDALLEELPQQGRELLVRGSHDRMRALAFHLLSGYEALDAPQRQRLVAAFSRLVSELMPAHQHRLAHLSVDPLLAALAVESDPEVLLPMGQMLHRMAAAALPFAEHQLAGRIFSSLSMRQLELEEGGEVPPERRLLEQELEVDVERLLVEDLQSGDPERQERAAQMLGSIGRPAIPMLIEMIKQERQLRIGLLAAGILARLGPEAATEIKRQMVLEVTVELRFRIIELVDHVTRDVLDELAICIGDPNAKIRRAAFRLAERLKDDRIVDILIRHARSEDIGPAKGAMRSLAGIRSEEAVAGLVRLLQAREEPEWVVACAQALGQAGHPGGIDALARLLGERRHLVFGRRWDDQVRSTAAFALAQIDDRRAREVLAGFAGDPDPRIQRAAASVHDVGEPRNEAPAEEQAADERRESDELGPDEAEAG